MRDYTTPITRIESLPEMRAAMDQELARVRARHGWKESDRAIFERHVALYVLADYFERRSEERDRILERGRKIMEERRRARVPVYWQIEDAEAEAHSPPGSARDIEAIDNKGVPVADELDISPSNSDRPPAATTPGRRKGAAG